MYTWIETMVLTCSPSWNTHKCTQTCVYAHTERDTHMRHTCIHTRTHAHTHTHTETHTRAYTMHTQAYAHTHTHMHTVTHNKCTHIVQHAHMNTLRTSRTADNTKNPAKIFLLLSWTYILQNTISHYNIIFIHYITCIIIYVRVSCTTYVPTRARMHH